MVTEERSKLRFKCFRDLSTVTSEQFFPKYYSLPQFSNSSTFWRLCVRWATQHYIAGGCLRKAQFSQFCRNGRGVWIGYNRRMHFPSWLHQVAVKATTRVQCLSTIDMTSKRSKQEGGKKQSDAILSKLEEELKNEQNCNCTLYNISYRWLVETK